MNKEKWLGWNIYSYRNRFSPQSKASRTDLIKKYKTAEKNVLALVAQKHKPLYFGETAARLEPKQLSKLEQTLSKTLSVSEYKIAIRYLNHTLAFGSKQEQLNWSIPDTLVVSTYIKKSLPHIYHRTMSLKKDAGQFICHFINHLEMHGDPVIEAGRLIWSAVLLGGYTGTIRKFYSSLEKNLHHDHHGLYLVISESTNAGTVLWYADSITETLILRFIKHHDRQLQAINNDKRLLSAAYSKFGNFLFTNSGLRPPKYKSLLEMCGQLHGTYLPSFLCHFDGSRSLSASVSSHTWQRIKDGRIDVCQCRKNIKTVDTGKKIQPCHEGNCYEIEKKRFYQGLRLFSGKKADRLTKKTIKNIIDAMTLEMTTPIDTSMAAMLLIWASHRTLVGRRGKKPIAIKSAHDYLCAFGSKLIHIMAIRKSLPQNEDDWIDVYNEMLDSVLEKQIMNVSCRAIDFHEFIVEKGWACSIDSSAVRRYGPKGKSVDANLVTYHEMDILFSRFTLNSADRKERMQRLITALGFYCGMRVSEILSLMISDLGDGPSLEIKIASNDYHDCKSDAAKRRMPAYIFLPADILNELIEFREMRIEEVSADKDSPGYHSLLFASPDEPSKVLNYDFIIKPIVDVLSEITKDERSRFHHLRHSFANWLFVRLLAPHYPVIIDQNIHAFQHSIFDVDKLIILSDLLMYEGHKVRPILYQIANLLGHATPKTTLKSYIHISDWVSARILRHHMEPKLKVFQLSHLFMIKKSTLYNWRKELHLTDNESSLPSSYLPRLRSKEI